MANAKRDENRVTSLLLPSTIDGTTLLNVGAFSIGNVNPMATAIVDAAGDQITSFGGGTQYTDGGTPPANPVGPTLIWDEGGTWQTVSTAKPLPVTASIDTTGLATSAKQDTGNTSVASIDTKTPALGQALAAASVPVVLTAAQLTTLTPVSTVTVTGVSTLAEQQTQTTALGTLLTSANFAAAFGIAGTADSQVMSVQGIASMTPVQVSQATASNLNATVVGTGTFVTQATLAAETTKVIGTINIAAAQTLATVTTVGAVTSITNSVTTTAVGTIADDSTTPGAPVMVGGTGKSPDGTDPGSVSAENDVTRNITDLNRRLFVNTRHPRQLHKHLNGSSAYTDESIVADPGDGFQVVITSIIGSTGAATALNFFLEEGASTIFGPIYLEAVAGRGFVSGPIYLPVTASTAVTLTSSAAIAQSFDIDYFIQAV